MGTDIHFFMDKKVVDEQGVEQFVPVAPLKYDGNRHYYLFAWLANVRNGYGFAGCDTGDVITPIVHPSRGLPDDIKERLKAQGEEDFLDGEWLGDHSYNWLTSTEILEAAKSISPIKKRGVISYAEYAKWDKKTPLDSYSSGSFGKGIFTIDQADLTPSMEAGFAYSVNLNRALGDTVAGNHWVCRYVKRKVRKDGIYSFGTIYNWNTDRYERTEPEYNPDDWEERWVAKRVLKRRKSVLKHQRKLRKYSERVGNPKVRAEWGMSHEALYEEFDYFIEEIRALHDEHGEFRMVMGFDS